LVALATANPFTPPHKVVPLDFTGIDTLEFHKMAPQIRISSRQAPQASYIDEIDNTLETRRAGSRLVITANFKGYSDLQLSIPPSVRVIDVEGATLIAKESLQSMQVSSSEDMTWDGDIARLDLRDTAHHSNQTHDDCSCSATSFTVSNGHIGELLVRAPHGNLRLSHPDKIDAAYAWLGEKGGVSLEKARRFDNIHLLTAESQIPDSVEAMR